MTISDVASVVRNLVQDFAINQVPGDFFIYTTSNVFTLTEPNAQDIIDVFVNGAHVGSGGYSYDQVTKKVTMVGLPTLANIEIQYSYYPNYSDREVEGYVRSAIVYMSTYNYYTFEVDTTNTFFPEVTEREKNLIALVASILMKPDNQNIRLPDMTITNAVNLPTRDIIAKVIRMFKHDNAGMFDIINPYYPPYWMRIH